MMFQRGIIAVIASVSLMGCASQQVGNYVRTDGRLLEDDQRRAAMAQCKEEASAVKDTRAGSPAGALDQSTAVAGCMARNGYVMQ
jgi:hypothetical protein